MPVPPKLKDRYEIKEILGQGGMGLVYRALDTVVKRDVALKTIRDAPTRAALQLFYKECQVLAAISHPNIIEIFDVGEFEEEGKARPYFVMPLLPGATLDKLIRDSSHRLTVERTVEIVVQTCRGLQAAHESGLVHRDLKPSNIFVMQDDSVKIIDFGVAHMVDIESSMGPKGTLLYMAPEQLQMQPPSAMGDIFSLAVVCYEVLTRRRPFERPSENEVVEAVLHHIPPPASDLNPAVGQNLSRVIHKAMAKQPWHRFSSAREFAECLQKGLRNEPIEFFDTARIQPRIQRATAAFGQGDYQFAGEILSEMEAEGHIDPAISMLRRQIDQTIRQKTIAQLLESARTRFEHEEHTLSLQKIQEILQLDPTNSGALGLKTSIEKKLTWQKIEDWFRLARQHLDNHAYSHAREALQNVLQLKPNETRALQVLSEVDRLEQEYMRVRSEKHQLYQSALEAWQNGEISAALTKLERVLDLDRRAPDTSSPEHAASYQNLYNQVRSKNDAIKNSYAEARKYLADRNFAPALAICQDFLAEHPGHALFQALKFDIEEQQRQELSARIAEIGRQAEAEPDLDRRVGILEEAVAACPGEPHFENSLRLIRDKRDLVNSIVGKARLYEEGGQFNEALAQWEILETIYGQYPGLSFEVERVIKRRDQQVRSETKARWVEQIDRCLESGDSNKALELLQHAQAEFPNDRELMELAELGREAMARTAEAQRLLAEGQELCTQHRFEEGRETLRRACQLDERNAIIRAALVDALVEQAQPLLDTDWRAAEGLIQQALELDPSHLLAKSLRTLAHDRKREEEVVRCFSQVRQLRAAGDLKTALAQAEQCLSSYPLEPRLIQLLDFLTKEYQESQRKQARSSDLEELKRLDQESGTVRDWAAVEPILERARAIARQHPDDPEMQSASAALTGRLAVTSADLRRASEGQFPPPPVAREVLVPEPPAGAQTGASAPAAPLAAVTPLPGGTAPPAVEPRTPPPGREVQGPAPAPAPPAVRPARPPGRARNRALVWGIVSAAAVVTLVVTGILVAPHFRKPSVATIPVEVRTSPPGATIRVDNQVRGRSNLRLQLPQGTHQLEAVLEGYQPAASSLNVQPGALAPIELTLQPLPQIVRLISNLEAGQVVVDEQPARELQQGQLILDNLSLGKHTVKVSGRYGEASFGFAMLSAAAPLVSGPVAAKNVVVLVVSAVAGRVHVYSSLSAAKIALDGQPAGEAGAAGLELNNLAPGPHELTVGEGSDRRKFIAEIGSAPALTAFLQSDRNVGTLLLLTGEDNVSVFLNGQKYSSVTKRGQLRITGEPKEYRVRVAKEGFQEEPEQIVRVNKGEEVKLEFKLRPLPKMEGWQEPWTQEGNWYVRRGGDFVLYRPTPNGGTFAFNAMLASGGGVLRGKRLSWVVAFQDERNYLLFQLDKELFRRIQVVNGKKTELRKPHGLGLKDYVMATLQIEVTAAGVSHKVRKGEQWVALDTFTAPGQNFALGKFGFLIQGKDEVRLSDFSFHPAK